MSGYAYRLVVESWPTPDGLPWRRWYGSDHGIGAEIPEWLDAKVCEIRMIPWQQRDWRLYDRVKEHDDGEGYSVVMPVPRRKVMLSASGAHGIARHMTAFGAVVRVERSEPITWTNPALNEHRVTTEEEA